MKTRYRSILPGIDWPAAISPQGAMMLLVRDQMEESQWWDRAAITAMQFSQMENLIRHAYKTVPFHKARLKKAGFGPGKKLTPGLFSRIPILTRAELQQTGSKLYSKAVPKEHGKQTEISTSGSTGRFVTVRTTEWAQMMWKAVTMRDHLWHKRDINGTLASIRHYPPGKAMPPDGHISEHWGMPVALAFETGPSVQLNSRSPLSDQLKWLEQQNPDYLLTYPSNLKALAEACRDRGIKLPNLRETRSFGEALGPDVRNIVRDVWGVDVVDNYSSQEVGYMALQAPEGEHYLVQSEAVYLEVLNEKNRPCKPGETGRIIVTPLHNFATPLIRYEIGDYAEVGDTSPCGRGLPVLNRILGRVRNMLTMPDGEKIWPYLAAGQFSDIAPVTQFRIIQKSTDRLELHLAATRDVTKKEEAVLKAHLNRTLGHEFAITFHYHDEITRSKSGKFEDVISEV